MSNLSTAPAGVLPGALIFEELFTSLATTGGLDWQPFFPGVDAHWIYREGEDGAAAAFLRFQPGARVPTHEHRGFEHILVLSGSQRSESGLLRAGSLMVHPPGTCHSIISDEGCLVLAIYQKRAYFPLPSPQKPKDPLP